MPVRLRVIDKEGGLCLNCRNATVVKGRSRGGSRFVNIKCSTLAWAGHGSGDGTVKGLVEECGSFSAMNRVSLYDMKEQAWLFLQQDKKVGFVHPQKLTAEQKKLVSDLEEP